MIVTVTPNPSLDWTLRIPRLRRGEVNRAVGQLQEPSGKGVNVSRALTVNGIASHAVLPLDLGTGAEVGRLLEAEGIGFTAVAIDDAVRTNVSLSEPGGTATKVNTGGPTLTSAQTGRLLDEVERRARGAAWVVGAGSLPGGVPEDFYAELGRLAHRAGSRFALDSSGTAFATGLSARPDLVKPNVGELEQVLGTPLEIVADVVVGARELGVAGARTVVVSLGPDGALLHSGDTLLHASAVVPHVESTVGAGDALLAGLLASADSTTPSPVDMLREGVAWASAAVAVDGSRVPVVTGDQRRRVRLTDEPDLRRTLPRDSKGR